MEILLGTESLAVLGAVVTFLLGVNAYYFKDLVRSMNDIKIEMTKMASEHIFYVELVKKHEGVLEKLRDRMHKLEGGNASVLQYLKDVEREQCNREK